MRGYVRAEGRQDRAADRREVPRPAEHPPGPHAQAAVSLATSAALPEVSVLVPAKDEADNLPEFVRQAREALLPLPYPCEIVVIDDGSRDGTADVLRDLAAKHPFLQVVTHRSQHGIADALASGADAARGRVLVFYPADLQYRPSDIPSLVQPILDDAADVVAGTKQGHYEKRFVSWVYNGLCRWLFGVRVTDLNSVKAYRREVMDGVTRRPAWHRFMVVIAAAEGFRVAERPVPLQPRPAPSTGRFALVAGGPREVLTRPGHQPRVEIQPPPHDGRPVELLAQPASAAPPEPAGQVGVVAHPPHGCRQRSGVARRNEQARHAILHDVRNPADPACDHRSRVVHRFEQHDAEPFCVPAGVEH